MNRRSFLKGAAAGSVVIIGAGAYWLNSPAYTGPLTIANTLQTLDSFAVTVPSTTGVWNLTQVLQHCAQSVEFSMTGFPEHKSPLFKQTAGKAAFSVFAAKRKMSHALDEPIPGAPVLENSQPVQIALERFKQALIGFDNFQGTLQPHFAYGALSKNDYEKAHVMHFNNHLLEIV